MYISMADHKNVFINNVMHTMLCKNFGPMLDGSAVCFFFFSFFSSSDYCIFYKGGSIENSCKNLSTQ